MTDGWKERQKLAAKTVCCMCELQSRLKAAMDSDTEAAEVKIDDVESLVSTLYFVVTSPWGCVCARWCTVHGDFKSLVCLWFLVLLS